MTIIKSVIGLILLGINTLAMAAPATYDPITGELVVPVLRLLGATGEDDLAWRATFVETTGSFTFGCPSLSGPTVQPLSNGDGIFDALNSELTLPEVVYLGTETPRYRVVLLVDLINCIVSIDASRLRLMGRSCDKRFSASIGFTGTCTEFSGSMWQDSPATLEELCNHPAQAPTTWSNSSCPQQALVGYCRLWPGSSLESLIHYYENYPPVLIGSATVAEAAENTCNTQPTAEWVLVN